MKVMTLSEMFAKSDEDGLIEQVTRNYLSTFFSKTDVCEALAQHDVRECNLSFEGTETEKKMEQSASRIYQAQKPNVLFKAFSSAASYDQKKGMISLGNSLRFSIEDALAMSLAERVKRMSEKGAANDGERFLVFQDDPEDMPSLGYGHYVTFENSRKNKSSFQVGLIKGRAKKGPSGYTEISLDAKDPVIKEIEQSMNKVIKGIGRIRQDKHLAKKNAIEPEASI